MGTLSGSDEGPLVPNFWLDRKPKDMDLTIEYYTIHKYYASAIIVCPPPLSKGGNPNFENFKKGEAVYNEPT